MKCQKCHKHKATINWVGEGGIMAFSHGMYERWCECCTIKAQIEHIEKVTKNLAELKIKLKNTKCL